MSALAAASRTRVSLPLSCLSGSRNAGPSITQLPQKRDYATQRKGQIVKQGAQSFRGLKNRDGSAIPVKQREKRLGSFRPMAPGQLTQEVFGSDRLNELELPYFRPEDLTQANTGKAMEFPNPENDAIRIFGVPKNMLVDFRVLSKPASVVRDVTLKVVDRLQAAREQSSQKNRIIFSGSSGSGKSYLLLQAVEFAASTNWLVMYIPRAINLVNSTTTYTYDLRTQTYLQPVFAYQTLQRFQTVNSIALRSLVTETEIEVERRAPVPVGTPIRELIDIGLQDQSVAPTVLSELMDALGKQTQFPVLLAIDDFQALFSKSAYRDPHYAAIKSWHLSMPRLLLEYASGMKTFARGAVLGALSMTNTTYKLSTELRHALKLQQWLQPSPYLKVAPEIAEFTKGLQTLRVPEQLTVDEAAALFEVWAKDKALHTPSNDELFMAKYSESGGNPREFVWKGLLATLET